MNELELKTLLSKVEHYQKQINSWLDLNQLAGCYIQDGWVVAYLNYKVLIGKIHQGRMEFYDKEEFDPKYLLQLRAFDQQKELHIRRKDKNRFLLRYRMDDEGEPVEAVETCQVLWGRNKNFSPLQQGWIRLAEERGVELILPWEQILNKGSRMWLKTRNYIGHNEAHQVGYVDCRFVEFVSKEES
ncbi:MAG: CRISPR-associated protein Csx19 [Bacillota bacterium]